MALTAMSDLARDEGVSFLVLALSIFRQLGARGSGRDCQGDGFLTTFAARNPDIRICCLDEDVEEEVKKMGVATEALQASATDDHPGVLGHEVLARLLGKFLRSHPELLAARGSGRDGQAARAEGAN